MNYNIGDTTFTMGIHKGKPIKEIADTNFDYLKRYLAFDEDCSEHKAIDAIIKGNTWINKDIVLSEKLVVDACRVGSKIAPTMEGHVPNPIKLPQDMIDCKVSEWIMHHILSDIYGSITPPDENVYFEKTWKPNLVCTTTGQEFSVHSQRTTSAKHNEESWTFGTNDPEYKRLCDPKTKECFVLLDWGERIGKVRVIINLGTLHEKHLFDEPKRLEYRPFKKCVYYDKIDESDKCEL